MGFAVVAADMAARIGLVDFLNARVFWNPKQCKVSPGLRILALIIGCLVDPLALYRLEEFYAELDCAVLFGAERQAHDFNEDAMGRALLKLFESQVGQTFTALSRQAVERLALPGSATAHADTTTITLYGQYPDQNAGSLPAYGYNKDGHPECKQLVAGVVARSDGLPMAIDVCDGNMDDPTWTRDALLSQGQSLSAEIRSQTLFVADSKLLSHATVAALCDAGVSLVSRLPNTFGLEREIKAMAATAQHWTPIGALSTRHESATYRLWETTGPLGECTVRLVVVHSSALEEKARAQETVRLDHDATRLDQARQHWARRWFACREDAATAWDTWSRTKWVREAVWRVTHEIIERSQPEGSPQWQVMLTRSGAADATLEAERFRRPGLQ